MIRNVRHTGIVVYDLEASLHFYQNLLGFETVKRMEESSLYIDCVLALRDVRVTTVKLTSPDGQLIELLYYHSHPRGPKPREICEIGISHLAFGVDDLDHCYDRLRDHGVPFNSPPQSSPDGYAKVAFCRAPEGTFIELVELSG